MKHTNRKTSMVSAEMDLKLFMDLAVVFKPMLPLSAEFTKVAVIASEYPDIMISRVRS